MGRSAVVWCTKLICRLVTVRVIWTKNDVTLTKMSSAGVNGTEPQYALQ